MIDFDNKPLVPIKKINSLSKEGIEVFIKREDLIHPKISGNKYWKLKYNVKYFQENEFDTILTFGGAYSNHISAVATLTRELKIPTIGIIRGEELMDKINENPTLSYAKACGMQLEFVNRETYRDKTSDIFLKEWNQKYKNSFIIPEGGTNEFAVKGCQEILSDKTSEFDFICCPIGTGGTIAGILKTSNKRQTILGFPVLKNSGWIKDEIQKYTQKTNYKLITDYHFGGYAKFDSDLITFVHQFKENNGIPLEPIYTGKMIYGLNEMLYNQFFPKKSKILVIHTGGLQGLDGINNKLNTKGLKL